MLFFDSILQNVDLDLVKLPLIAEARPDICSLVAPPPSTPSPGPFGSRALSLDERKKVREEQLAERQKMALATGVCLFGLIAGVLLDYRTGTPDGGRSIAVYCLYALSYIAGAFFSAPNAFREILGGKANVDLLMVLAAVGAAIVGEWPEGAALLFLFSLSGTLERFVLGRTRQAIEELMDLTPEEAVVLENGTERRVPVDALQIGNLIVVRPGERISGES